MSKINVLDSTVYNLISAGEVVERPASVVKELFENSVDAGAKSVVIDIVDGGKTKIRVSDDGKGILKEDVEKAFLPHATSKISNAADLADISTLGFRGEALPSIASVSMLTIVTKTEEEDSATVLELSGGKITSRGETAANVGTTITINNLFFATPARFKFLKSVKGEENEITELVKNLALSNPTVSVRYSADGKQILKTDGKSLENAVFSVYNREITMNLSLIENTFEGFSIKGYLSKPTYFKGNRSYQTIVVNGRIVENKTITTAVEKGYEGYLMKRAFPLFVININVPSDFLDVNVHPAKTDVRFRDSNKLFGFIYHSVRKALTEFSEVKSVNSASFEIAADGEIVEKIAVASSTDYVYPRTDIYKDKENTVEQRLLPDDALRAHVNKDTNKIVEPRLTSFAPPRSSGMREDSGIAYRAIKAAMSQDVTTLVEKHVTTIDENADTVPKITDKPEVISFNGRVLGQLFNTYIVVEKETEVYFIDQHAAHERILYDELVSRSGAVFSQPMLFPYVFEANVKECDFMCSCLDSLREIGFEIEQFGNNSFKVSAVPDNLTDIDLDLYFAEILSDLSSAPNLKTAGGIKDRLAQSACKHAVKGGDTLNPAQIDALIKSLNENTPLQCPHGRPAVVKITKTEMEKWFKRIV